MNELKETWVEFHNNVQPKNGDTFLDDRNNKWTWNEGANCYVFNINDEKSVHVSLHGSGAEYTTCTLIAPEKPKLKQVILKCYLTELSVGILTEYWQTDTMDSDIPVFDEQDNQLTKTVWVKE